jgi:hypothetical protein
MDTKYDRLLAALRGGAELTAKQISARYRVSQPYHLIWRMRENGLNVQLIERTNSKGENRNFYKLVETKRRRAA